LPFAYDGSPSAEVSLSADRYAATGYFVFAARIG
jgi:hypothetical protein